MSLTLILGGVRSGKSSWVVGAAERLGRPVTVIATAPRIDDDEDLGQRIEHHRRERPAGWTTIEEQLDLAGAITACDDTTVIIDCLTLWVNNRLWHGDDAVAVEQLSRAALAAVAERTAPTLVVTNEVGMGVHPTTAAGRTFSEVLGRVNQRWMSAAHHRLFMVAGHAVTLHDPPVDLR